MSTQDFSDEQKHYLAGFAAAIDLPRTLGSMPTFAATLGLPPDAPKPACDETSDLHRKAQDRFLTDGKKLTAEEHAKRKQNGLEIWDMIAQHARDARFPKGTDVFLFKFQGMFYVAPAQDAFMCRLRFPGGITNSHQLRGVADLAENFGGGYADVTTRANLQIRQIKPHHTVDVLMGLADLGIVNKGAGADNIRNITASPTAGVDRNELIDTRPLARELHHYILSHRELYGLPRKFNIAFDGGGGISALEDTNDIGFTAVKVGEGKPVPAGIYFRMALGGITGHKDFARDTGLLLKSEQCVPAAAAAVRLFIEHGDRTDRKKARLKYLLDKWGHEKFIAEMETLLLANCPAGASPPSAAAPLLRLPIDQCEPRPSVMKHGHIGFHTQKQPGKYYVGVVLPVGRMRSNQMRGLAEIADRYGSGSIRLTVWQNLLISDIPAEKIPAVRMELRNLGLHYSADSIRSGLVACTGNAGCKYAAANTKAHATEIADYLESRLRLDHPINIHLTGCHHSCAQHYIGDIGLLATKVSVGEDTVEGYHLYIGGGFGPDQEIGRELYRDIVATDLPRLIERIGRSYLEFRLSKDESFRNFSKRYSADALRIMFDEQAAQMRN